MSTDTTWRYVNEGVEVLADQAPSRSRALKMSGEERRLLLDGTPIRTWRYAALATEANTDPLYRGKHHDHA